MAALHKLRCSYCAKILYRDARRYNENTKLGHRFYCSNKCADANRMRRRELRCDNPRCNKLFWRTPSQVSLHNYCSRTCAVTVNNHHAPKRIAKLGICKRPACGKMISANRSYCSDICLRTTRFIYSKGDVQELIQKKTAELGRAPVRREMTNISAAYVRHFGSWTNALVASGLKPNRSHSERMYRRSTAVATDGHLCDSISEALIDNWLHRNDFPHSRDVVYPKTHHKADWEVRVGNQRTFIEYFGLINDSPRYDKTIRLKRHLCSKSGIPLIELYPKDLYPRRRLDDRLRGRLTVVAGNKG